MLKQKNIYSEPYPEDIAKTLAGFAGADDDKTAVQELTDALYWVKCAAENEHNQECWRTFYDALLILADMFPADLPFC